MTEDVKKYLDKHYQGEEPTLNERYYITFSKMYALKAAGLISSPPVCFEIPTPELD